MWCVACLCLTRGFLQLLCLYWAEVWCGGCPTAECWAFDTHIPVPSENSTFLGIQAFNVVRSKFSFFI